MTVTATSTATADAARTADGAPGTVRRLPRRLPAPATEPRYDDERGGRFDPPASTQGALALDLTARTPLPDATERHLRLVPQRKRRDDGGDEFFAPQPTPSAALPDPGSWSGRYVQALLEVLSGDRPATQLMRWTSDKIYTEVNRRVARTRGRTSPTTRGQRRVLVRSVHVCEPGDGVAEVAVHVKHGERSRAVALRLEGLDGRWRCTALQMA